MTARALIFATKAHGEQKRKYTGEPYVNHCIAVAGIVKQITMDADIICAALLHDTVEDTAVTIDNIAQIFGQRIAKLVSEVTDISRPLDGNRQQRKEIDRKHLAQASPDGMTIKLADLIDNTSTIVKYDPHFAKIYMAEKRELLKVLTNGNPILFREANELVENYFLQSKQMEEK